jgi:hypothetical protein
MNLKLGGKTSLVIKSLNCTPRQEEEHSQARACPPNLQLASCITSIQSKGRKEEIQSFRIQPLFLLPWMHAWILTLWLDLPYSVPKILFSLTSKLIFGHRSLFFNSVPLVPPRDNYFVHLSFLISTPTLMIYDLRITIPQTRPYHFGDNPSYHTNTPHFPGS